MELNKKQLNKLEKLSKVIDGGDIALLNEVIAIEEKLEEKIDRLNEKLEKLDPEELVRFDDLDELHSDEERQASYVLTESDKEDIALKVTVPIVEKVIETVVEKTEVIKEIPIITQQITNEIREVAVLDVDNLPQYGEKYRDGLELIAEEDEKLSIEAIGYLKKRLQDLENKLTEGKTGKTLSASRGYFLSVDGEEIGLVSNLNFVSGSNVTITHSIVDGQNTLRFTSTGGGGATGIGSMVIGSTFTVT